MAFTTTWFYVLEPALRLIAIWREWGNVHRMSNGIRTFFALEMRSNPKHPDKNPLLWMAYAFAKRGEDLKFPLMHGLLNPVLDEAERQGIKFGLGDLRKLHHFTIALRSRTEREEYRRIKERAG